eukprot:CAMPEP_0201731222 /NCGR_PEP_ID=MMETSP0593-20130828/24964_1 /ASSEMBLY_ACC=CAM_ASM_000672 /TAXON_ID=267983 /ORGANISM="Skeletonema japonicum, Strain CCMP2506" /LENGTH=198 /DNA_ID=CAMNT_0048223941 /DNA_START=22 /DNA_END=618 /DNA_ORIENTATION=+
MVSNTTHGSRRALMSSRHCVRHFLLLSGVTSMMPTVTNAFTANTRNRHQPVASIHRRNVHLPKRNSIQLSSSSNEEQSTNSVTGPIYEMMGADNSTNNIPNIQLFTKEGCTLCDKVKDVLSEIRNDYPHSLYAVDITDDDKQVWFEKYKYDIPVLHMDDVYWAKHRLTKEEAIQGIEEAVGGEFEVRQGDPDAGRLEH